MSWEIALVFIFRGIRSLKSFALMDSSSAFATNSSHVTYKMFLQSSFIYRELNSRVVLTFNLSIN